MAHPIPLFEFAPREDFYSFYLLRQSRQFDNVPIVHLEASRAIIELGSIR